MCPAICPSCCAPLFAFSVESDSFLSTLGVVPLACILQPIGPSPPPIFRIDAAIREPTGRASGGRTRRDSQRPCPSCLRTFLGWIKFGFHVDRLPLFVGRGCPWVLGEGKDALRHATRGNFTVAFILFDADCSAVEVFRCAQRCAAPHEWVEHRVGFFGREAN